MWLPETAVDTLSLELLADEGIRFVVLAPHQCARVRPINGTGQMTFEHEDYPQDGRGDWTETPNASVDTTRPYLVRLSGGRC